MVLCVLCVLCVPGQPHDDGAPQVRQSQVLLCYGSARRGWFCICGVYASHVRARSLGGWRGWGATGATHMGSKQPLASFYLACIVAVPIVHCYVCELPRSVLINYLPLSAMLTMPHMQLAQIVFVVLRACVSLPAQPGAYKRCAEWLSHMLPCLLTTPGATWRCSLAWTHPCGANQAAPSCGRPGRHRSSS